MKTTTHNNTDKSNDYVKELTLDIIRKAEMGIMFDTLHINNLQDDVDRTWKAYNKYVQHRQSLKAPYAIKKYDRFIADTKTKLEQLTYAIEAAPDKIAQLNKANEIINAVKTSGDTDDIQIKFVQVIEGDYLYADMLYCYLILDPNCKYSDTPLYCGWDMSFTPPFNENNNWIEDGCTLFPVWQ